MKDLAEKMKVGQILDVSHNQEKKLKTWQSSLFNEEPLSPFEVVAIIGDKKLPYIAAQV